jgi:large subunit ribosomal protein L30
MTGRLRITYSKSAIGHNHRQKATIVALGFHKLNSTVEQPDTPSTWGMIRKVQHLVRVERIGEEGQ